MKSIKFDNFEITAREIIASIVIIFIMLLIGVTISNKMQESRLDRNEIYNKAVKIETSELFQYGMRTNVGSAFVSGTLEAVDPVSYPEIEGEYLYLEKVKRTLHYAHSPSSPHQNCEWENLYLLHDRNILDLGSCWR